MKLFKKYILYEIIRYFIKNVMACYTDWLVQSAMSYYDDDRICIKKVIVPSYSWRFIVENNLRQLLKDELKKLYYIIFMKLKVNKVLKLEEWQ